ncbi:hypothetical protein G1H11_00970 [Phytoactinopolyspora alkaliphila]|uniref:LPXTG cell wall anchor domain-containing protein n=1 Tax=Phytoactinopolyspora alkaliphila TaxID=1783498 RepID=A0A6N9YFX0_9ACTN|nr:hypothetical protein [Phytoactinopolyspora alkaliphila]NED93883.1 hypothetical protein [Phytoactinopolyspora alkaliphila]
MTAPEWLDVRSEPSAPEFDGLAPGSTVEWLAIVTNTAAERASLALTVIGDDTPLTGIDGLQLEIESCPGDWISSPEQRGPYSCTGDTSTVRALSAVGGDEAIPLPDIGSGETREYLARATLPADTGNDLQAQDGQIRLNFTSTMGTDGPDIPDTGADLGLLLILAVLAVAAGLTLRTLRVPHRRGSRPPARG